MTEKTALSAGKFSGKSRDTLLIRQMLSMGLSMLTAEIVSMLYPVDQSFWIALTTFCVCLYISTPLTALRRTAHRILGSIYGVILAGIACLVFPETAGLLTFLVLFAGLTLWSRAFMSLYWLFVAFMTASVIMLLALLMRHTSLTPEDLPDPETRQLLSQNRTETKKALLSLIRLNRDAASGHLAKLSEINTLLEKRLLGQKGVSATIMLTLRELENDLSHLAGGAVQMYLTYKNGNRD